MTIVLIRIAVAWCQVRYWARLCDPCSAIMQADRAMYDHAIRKLIHSKAALSEAMDELKTGRHRRLCVTWKRPSS